MQVVILAATKDEAEVHRKWAGLSPRDSISIGNPRALEGLALHDEDLIVELPSFCRHRDADKIRLTLSRIMRRNGEVPRWEKITG
jgi:hypothetical protein